MAQVVAVGHLRARAGAEEELRELLEEIARATHAEAGCLAYAVHRDRDDARHLVVVSRWTSPVALDSHLVQPHVRDAGPRLMALLEGPPDTSILDPVVLGDPLKGVL